MTPFLLFSSLIAFAAVPYFPWKKEHERTLRFFGIGAGVLTLVFTAVLAVPVLLSQQNLWDGFWFLNEFSAFLALLIAFIYCSATLVSYQYIGHEYHENLISFSQVRLYYALLPLFILAMLAAVFSDNIGMLWVTLEGTTLATTLLVAFYKKEGALEAAWKYILLCSTGISLGLLGILMINYAAMNGGSLSPEDALSLTALKANAHTISPDIMRWAFVFIFVGFGSKVGFFPLHSWLPDAHSRTPSPISALLSGVLLNVALFAILQIKGLTDLVLQQSAWTTHFFLVFGLLSVLFASFTFLTQKHYKRLLAYSSIKHMGFIAFAIGLGPLGVIPAVLHLAGHALTKSALFFAAGNILSKFKTTKSDHIQEVIAVLPYTGTLFILSLLFLLAAPPSLLFLSEIMVLQVSFSAHLFLTFLVVFVLILVFVGMMRHVVRFVLRKPFYTESQPPISSGEKFDVTHIVIVVHLVLGVLLGASFFTDVGQGVLHAIAQNFIFLP
ncbi:MAG: proton-conducting transporter membrane subunit [Candidatus Peregrinibacteria bacterium]